MPDAFRGTESTEGAESSPPAAIHLAMAPRLARTIVLLVLTCYCFIVILNVLHTGGVSATRMTVCVGVVLLEFGVQFALALPAARAWPLRRRLVTLGVQAVLTYLPAAWFGLDWGSMQGRSQRPSCSPCPTRSPGRCSGPSWRPPRSTRC